MRKLLALLALAFAFALPAHAEVWGFVDDKGVAHFAAERVDERYELFFRGGESFDTEQGGPTPRAVAVPTRSTSKLLAYFADVSGLRAGSAEPDLAAVVDELLV